MDANAAGTCPTVTIQTKQGPVTINKSDYDPKAHKLASTAKKPAAKNLKASS